MKKAFFNIFYNKCTFYESFDISVISEESLQ